jgi:uncharacterized membrane protein
MKEVILRILAMVLLVVSAQQLIRGIWSGIWGNGYNFSVFGLSDMAVIIIAIMLILISLYLFHITESFFDEEKRDNI